MAAIADTEGTEAKVIHDTSTGRERIVFLSHRSFTKRILHSGFPGTRKPPD
jgi:hypothetical protein